MVSPIDNQPDVRYRWTPASVQSGLSPDVPVRQIGPFGVIRFSRRAGNYLTARFGFEAGKWVGPENFCDDKDASAEFEIELDKAEGVLNALEGYLKTPGNQEEAFTNGLYRELVMAIGSAAHANLHEPYWQALRERTGRRLVALATELELSQGV